MEEYKGIYYNHNAEQQYYEGGAHFKYIELYKILEEIAKKANSKKIPKTIKQNTYLSMRTRNNKNNLSQSKTNNDNNYCTNKNDINLYLNKYIFNKKKTRNRNDNALLNKNTFNLSNPKYDISGSINGSTNTYLNNHIKNINFNKNFFVKSRNKIPSCFKGRPNTIFKNN